MHQTIKTNLLFKRTQIHNDSCLRKHALHPLHSFNRDGRWSFFKNGNSKRQKKWLVTLPGTTAKCTTSVFDCTSHFKSRSEAVLFYIFLIQHCQNPILLNIFVLSFSLIFNTLSLCRCMQSRLKGYLVNRDCASLCFIFPKFWPSRCDKPALRIYFCLLLAHVL